MIIVADALQRQDWLVGNFGPRCTLVSAASGLRLLGAKMEGKKLVAAIERRVDFKESRLGLDILAGPHLFDYPELPFRRAPLDLAIEAAAAECGMDIEARGRVLFRWRTMTDHLRAGGPILLHCLKAPSGSTSHTVICVGFDPDCADALVTVDPNDGAMRLKERGNRSTGIITSATFIKQRCATVPLACLRPGCAC